MIARQTRDLLEKAYRQFHCRQALVGDPWEFPAGFSDRRDMECAGFLSAVISFGSKKAIARTLSVLSPVVGKHPASFAESLVNERVRYISRSLPNHRWTRPADLARILKALGRLYRKGDCLANFFENVPLEIGLNRMARWFKDPGLPSYLVPAPENGSACKRVLMFLRWMVRDDGLDFGVWKGVVHPRDLIIPLDIHAYRVARALGLTQRRSVNWKTALEVTQALKQIDPEDPVRFDFALHYLSYARSQRDNQR